MSWELKLALVVIVHARRASKEDTAVCCHVLFFLDYLAKKLFLTFLFFFLLLQISRDSPSQIRVKIVLSDGTVQVRARLWLQTALPVVLGDTHPRQEETPLAWRAIAVDTTTKQF